MKPTLFVSALAAVLGSASMTLGHEFWIEPTEFQVQNDEAVVADLRNGELFEGTSLSFSERRNTRMEAVMGDAVTPVAGRMGDRPAIQLPAIGEDGLLILVHEAAPATVSYRDWAKFLRFAAHKDFDTAEAIHIARGWAQDDFEERYTRHSKALIAVGDGAGADRALGLATEFVALDNPYAADFDGTMDVALLYDGAPRSDAQIEVYARDAQDQVTVSIAADGCARACRHPRHAGRRLPPRRGGAARGTGGHHCDCRPGLGDALGLAHLFRARALRRGETRKVQR